jgi:hypothetical protein
MAEFTQKGTVGRRGFLRGSAFLAAAAVGLTAAGPAFAQQPGEKPDEKKPEEKKPEERKPEGEAKNDPAKKDTPARQGEQARNEDPNRLIDKDGREYRVCERCGGNMYKDGNTWTCEQCGFSYVE